MDTRPFSLSFQIGLGRSWGTGLHTHRCIHPMYILHTYTHISHTHEFTLTSPHVEVGYCISTAGHLVVQKPRLFLAEAPLDKRRLTWLFSFHAGLSKCVTCLLREREWTIPRWEISSSLLPNFPGSPHSGFPRESGYYDSVHDRTV